MVKATILRKKTGVTKRKNHVVIRPTPEPEIQTEEQRERKALVWEIVQLLSSPQFFSFLDRRGNFDITVESITQFLNRKRERHRQENVSAAMSAIWTSLGSRKMLTRERKGRVFVYEVTNKFNKTPPEELIEMV